MMTLLVYLAIFVIVIIVVWFLLTQIPLPPPLDKILTIVAVVIGALILIGILLQFAGGGAVHFPALNH